MKLAVGDQIPDVALLNQIGSDVREIELGARIQGKKVVILGLPGAYTGLCSTAHLPSFVRTADAFRKAGVDEIICIAVNDVRVMSHWGKTSGAEDAGILMLADWDSEFARKSGLAFSVPAIGFKNRITRFAAVVENGEVIVLQYEDSHGVCDLTSGETLLEKL